MIFNIFQNRFRLIQCFGIVLCGSEIPAPVIQYEKKLVELAFDEKLISLGLCLVDFVTGINGGDNIFIVGMRPV